METTKHEKNALGRFSHPGNIYLELTAAFNAGHLRAIICSGQAVVLHRVAIMSKDGDWIIREEAAACRHVLSVLEREKDYAVIGELARRMTEPADQLLFARGARDLMELAARHPGLARRLAAQRPLLRQVTAERERLEAALDAERRALMRANEERLSVYVRAAEPWAARWSDTTRLTEALPLKRAHAVLVERAMICLPFEPRVTGEDESQENATRRSRNPSSIAAKRLKRRKRDI